MDNTRLDALLAESLSQLPLPRDIPKKVNPWSALFRLLVWGVVSSLLGALAGELARRYAAPLFPLAALLLAVTGQVLQYAAFRGMRAQNRWAGLLWYLSGLDLLRLLLTSGLAPVLPAPPALTAPSPGLWAALGYHLLFLTALWRGVLSIQRQAGRPTRGSPATRLFLWGLAADLTPFLLLFLHRRWDIPPTVGPVGWVGSLAAVLGPLLLLLLVLILLDVLSLARQLDQARYVLVPRAGRLSPPALLGLSLALVCLLRGACALLV